MTLYIDIKSSDKICHLNQSIILIEQSYPFHNLGSNRFRQYSSYAWIDGEELTNIVIRDDFQWIWGVLSGFDKNVLKNDILKYGLPYAEGYKGFWKEQISMQHPLASIELVAWDSSCTLLLSNETAIIKKFREVFPLSEDLKEYNSDISLYNRKTDKHMEKYHEEN